MSSPILIFLRFADVLAKSLGLRSMGAAEGAAVCSARSYTVTETDPGVNWTVAVSDNPTVVSASGGEAAAKVTNTHKRTEVLGQELARTGGNDRQWRRMVVTTAIVSPPTRVEVTGPAAARPVRYAGRTSR